MRLTLAAVMLCLLAPAIYAQDLSDFTAGEKLFFDPALREADYDAHAKKLLALIESNPGSVESLVALRRVLEFEDELADTRPIFQTLETLAGNDFKACGRWADEYVEAYLKFAQAYVVDDMHAGRRKIALRWQGLTDVVSVGPFGDSSGSVHDDVFGPEALLDFGAEYDGAWGRIGWRKVRHDDPFSNELDLFAQQRWTGYGYYVAANLISEAARDVLAHLEFGGPGKVWLNGVCVGDYDARRKDFAENKTLRLSLARGRNVLLVKLSAVSSISLNVRDLNGRPIDNLVTTTPGPGDPLVTFESRTARTNVTTAEMRLVEEKYAGQGLGGEVFTRLLGASIYAHHEQFARAGECFELFKRADARKFVDKEWSMNFVALEQLRGLESNPLLSRSRRRSLARQLIDDLTSGEVFLPGVFEQAKILSSDQRSAEAIKLLELQLETVSSRKWRVYLAMGEVFADARWRMEREKVLKLAKSDATALPVLGALSRYYSDHGALANEVESDLEILKIIPGDPDTHVSLMHTRTRMGQIEEALKHARLLIAGDPDNEFLHERLAEILAASGAVSKSLTVYETLATRSPLPERDYFNAAKVCLQLGRDEQAINYLERALKVDPGHHMARRQLMLMRGEDEDFWTGHAVTREEFMRHDIRADDFPRADSGIVLDEMVQQVYADGSAVAYVHQVRKILTQEGVDVRGRENITGELINARTIKPDGTVLEPITQVGGTIEFPGVEIGAYLEVEYLIRTEGGPFETLDGDAFYFVDQNFSEPFAISRWVILAPPQLGLTPIYHNLRADDPGVTITETREGDNVKYVWDVRDPRHPEREPFMPAPLEIIPWIEFTPVRSWTDRSREFADQGLGQIMDTALIAETTSALLKGLSDAGDIEKAREIYQWINREITTEGDAWNAHQALVAKAGDREELFISMCAAAGLRMGFAGVDAPQPYKKAPDESLPRPHWGRPHEDDFDTQMVVIENNNGARAYVEMDDRLRPFGEISTRDYSAPAIVWMDGEVEITHLPGGDREKDRFENRVNIQLNADGSAELSGSLTVRGERSYAMKESFRTASRDRLRRELESNLSRHYRGFEVGETSFPDLERIGAPLVQKYEGAVRRIADVTDAGMSLELPGEKLGRLLSVLVSEKQREFDLMLDFELAQMDEIRVTPPKGYVFADLPEDLTYPTSPLIYSLKFELHDGALVMKRKLVLGPGRFTPGDYSNLVEQVKQIKKSETTMLKLKKLK